MIGRDRRRELLASARSALADYLTTGRIPSPPTGAASGEPSADHCGVFVTLTCGGKLRGCVGNLDPRLSLDDAVPSCTVSAATDSRFEPLTSPEMDGTRIEISILGPWRPVEGPEEIRLGRDGLVVSAGLYRGLLLPRVAVDQGWGEERYLEETCRKAGLPPDAWRLEGTEVHAFEAEVFSELEPGPTGAPPDRRC